MLFGTVGRGLAHASLGILTQNFFFYYEATLLHKRAEEKIWDLQKLQLTSYINHTLAQASYLLMVANINVGPAYIIDYSTFVLKQNLNLHSMYS